MLRFPPDKGHITDSKPINYLFEIRNQDKNNFLIQLDI